MNNIRTKLIRMSALIIFIVVMTTGSFLKQPYYNTDDVIYYVDQLSDDIQKEKWEKANEQLEKIKKAWRHVVYRIQFSAERDEINTFKTNLERIRGFIIAEDKSGALADLSEMRYIWEQLGK